MRNSVCLSEFDVTATQPHWGRNISIQISWFHRDSGMFQLEDWIGYRARSKLYMPTVTVNLVAILLQSCQLSTLLLMFFCLFCRSLIVYNKWFLENDLVSSLSYYCYDYKTKREKWGTLLSDHRSVCPSVYLSLCLSVCPVTQYVWISILFCPSFHLSVCLSISFYSSPVCLSVVQTHWYKS
jgi:hypothetical protein